MRLSKFGLKIESVLIIILAVSVLCGVYWNYQQNTQNQKVEITKLATVWAECLKTRDGKPRYDMMSDDAKVKFIQGQKDRTGSDDWNYNIGVSSPWVETYTIDVKGLSATIVYKGSDSSTSLYEMTEKIVFIGVNEGYKVREYNLTEDWH